jgi:cytochrome c oxidase cbb3-type subunit III
MNRIKAFVLWAGISVLVVSAASGASSLADTRRGKSSAAVRGREVYVTNCARCHGADGQSHTSMGEITQAPDLTDSGWQSHRGNARMISSVTNGRGQMPAFGRKLSKSDIAAAVAYVRTLKH